MTKIKNIYQEVSTDYPVINSNYYIPLGLKLINMRNNSEAFLIYLSIVNDSLILNIK